MRIIKYQRPEINIPDYDYTGLRDTIRVESDHLVSSLSVYFNIQHPYSGDLSVELAGPDDLRVVLWSPTRGEDENLAGLIDVDLGSHPNLRTKGEWTLIVIDSGIKDSGTLSNWALEFDVSESAESKMLVEDLSTLIVNHEVSESGKVSFLELSYDIRHTHVGDLKVDLESPSGFRKILHNREGGNQANLIKRYNTEDLKEFVGEDSKGRWTLYITDAIKGDIGELKEWTLKIKTEESD